MITSASLGTGNAGNITIQADNINLTEGGFISSSALAGGLAGNISLTVTDTLFLSGRRAGTFIAPVTNTPFENKQSNITSFSLSGSGGQLDLTAKTIHLTKEATINASSMGLGEETSSLNLQAENLLLTEGGQINSSNGFYAGTAFLSGSGIGGEIRIQAKHLTLSNQHPHLQPTGIFSDTYSQGRGGNIEVQSESLDLTGDVAISARSYNIGDAGQLNLQASQVHLDQHSSISTAATQAGGGNINLTGLSGLLYLNNSEITTSVTTGPKGGGNITIEQPQFTILNKGLIRAQADAGNGGNIRIVAEQFIATPDSLVSASSRLGIDGQVVISSPDPNISGKLFLVSTKGLDVTNQLKRPCGGAKSLEEILNPRFKFYVYPIAGSRQSFEDWGPSPLPSRSVSSSSQVKTGKGSARGRGKPTTEKVAQAEYQPVALVVECPKEESIGRLE
jgi:hypothetical protein